MTALRLHLNGDAPGFSGARKLGLRAVALGLETLDVARLNDETLQVLISPRMSASAVNDIVSRSSIFLAEVLASINGPHCGNHEADGQMKRIIASLAQRTGELAMANTKLRLLLHRLLTVQEEERKSISRELNDDIGQTLTGINLRLLTLKSQTPANARDLYKKIAFTQQLVEKSAAKVHRFAGDLRPTVLDDLGLIPALKSHIDAFTDRTGLHVDLSVFGGVEAQDSAVRTVLYRVAQEALSNVTRHAGATRAAVRIDGREGLLHMDVTDNGADFRLLRASSGRDRHGLYLLGMRERVEMVGGTFSVEPRPGETTSIQITIPLRRTGTKAIAPKKP